MKDLFYLQFVKVSVHSFLAWREEWRGRGTSQKRKSSWYAASSKWQATSSNPFSVPNILSRLLICRVGSTHTEGGQSSSYHCTVNQSWITPLVPAPHTLDPATFKIPHLYLRAALWKGSIWLHAITDRKQIRWFLGPWRKEGGELKWLWWV